jgi:RNA polymerase sigma-70 factor (ECF subfamily)
MAKPIEELAATAETSDEDLVTRVQGGDRVAFELLMRRHNRRVYRAVRTVLSDAGEVEEVMQQTYVQAFSHLEQFQGAARWSTWVCRIAFNEALARVRQRGRFVSIDALSDETTAAWRSPTQDPEHEVGFREVARFLEDALDRLPDMYRAVLMFRQIEGLSTAETAHILDVEEAVVKTRLHRARALLRETIEQRLGEQMGEAYGFHAARCDRVVAAVLARLSAGPPVAP